MRKVILLTATLILFASVGWAEIRTREITPAKRQYTAGDTKLTNQTVWTPSLRHVVCDWFIISSDDNQEIILSASDTILKVSVTASQPVVSTGSFLWRGTDLETLLVSTEYGKCSFTFTGYEEP